MNTLMMDRVRSNCKFLLNLNENDIKKMFQELDVNKIGEISYVYIY